LKWDWLLTGVFLQGGAPVVHCFGSVAILLSLQVFEYFEKKKKRDRKEFLIGFA